MEALTAGGALPPPLAAVEARMRGFPAPWAVAGGWALDLFLGRVTRARRRGPGDLPRRPGAPAPAPPRWTFRKVVGGQAREWTEGERLSLPVHEIHAKPADDPSLTLEFLLNERAGDEWAFRRDPRVRCPADAVFVRTASGLPALCPAVVLLYKSKQPREADEADFAAVRDHLGAAHRAWLRSALETAHPCHPWIDHLPPGRR